MQRQGQLREAEKIYARVLKAMPDNFDALNLLGGVKAQLGHIGRGAAPVRRRGEGQSARGRRPGAISARCMHALKRATKRSNASTKRARSRRDDIAILNQHANALLSLGRAAGGARRIPGGFGARAAACRGAAQ